MSRLNMGFAVKKRELVKEIMNKISPLLNGLTYNQICSTLEAVRNRVNDSMYFTEEHQEIHCTKPQS